MGLCVDARVLPHNALPPVRVETMPVGDYLARLVGDSPPVIRSDWDVYLVGNSLIYKKEQVRTGGRGTNVFPPPGPG